MYKSQNPNHKSKPYSHPSRLIPMYAYMKAYQNNNGFPITIRELVAAGFAKSTSTVRYYMDHMEVLGMVEITRGVARGVKLLPLSEAHPVIKSLIGKEKENVSN